MSIDKNRIPVFEHQSLWRHKGSKRLSRDQLLALQAHYGEKGVPYYSLIHQGVKFKSYVGVIQIGTTTIEVLPKADKYGNEAEWREVLIGMLLAVRGFDVHITSSSNLRIRPNSILEVYFELFLREVERLLHQGLTKKYRKIEGNRSALKGSIQFPRHLQKNLIHKERFFVRHTTYDVVHKIHAILFKTLRLIKRINTNQNLVSRLGNLSLNFPEMPDLTPSEGLFKKIVYNRKTEKYKKALEIARLLLLNYHPDIIHGQNDVLALMFDMNVLWEQFVYRSLWKHREKGTSVRAQGSKLFWQSKGGKKSRMKPDILIRFVGDLPNMVLDTKWKNLSGTTPSPADLRQMYAYLKYHQAQKVALVFPGDQSGIESGFYFDELSNTLSKQECSLISIKTERDISSWQKMIAEKVFGWAVPNT